MSPNYKAVGSLNPLNNNIRKKGKKKNGPQEKVKGNKTHFLSLTFHKNSIDNKRKKKGEELEKFIALILCFQAEAKKKKIPKRKQKKKIKFSLKTFSKNYKKNFFKKLLKLCFFFLCHWS